MGFQQNLASKRAENSTAGSGYAVAVEKEDGSGQVAPDNRLHCPP
jgi:hypothetical protein